MFKIKLPLWFGFLKGGPRLPNQEDIERIAGSLKDDKEVICRVNNKAVKIYIKDEEVKIEQIREQY